MLQMKEAAFIQMALQCRKTVPHDIRCGLQTVVCAHVRPAWECPSWWPVQCHFKRQSRGTPHPPCTARNVVRGTKFNKPVHDGCTHTFLLFSPAHCLTPTRIRTHTCLSEGFTCVMHSTLNMSISWQHSCPRVVCELSTFFQKLTVHLRRSQKRGFKR